MIWLIFAIAVVGVVVIGLAVSEIARRRSPTVRHRHQRDGFVWLAQEAEGASGLIFST